MYLKYCTYQQRIKYREFLSGTLSIYNFEQNPCICADFTSHLSSLLVFLWYLIESVSLLLVWIICML